MAGPFAGLRIVEIAESIAGAYAGMLLAELGAEVTKVDPPGGSPLWSTAGSSVWNRSKKSVVLDLGGRDGQETLQRLVGGSDVFINDRYQDEARALGLDWEGLRRINPGMVYCSIPPVGEDWPGERVPRDDDVVAGHAGVFASQWAYREGPVYIVIPLSSYGAAFLSVSAIGSALLAKGKTGLGQRVEVSWLAGSFSLQVMHFVVKEPEEDVPLAYKDRDPLSGWSPFYRAYRASDDWLFIAAGHNTFASKTCIVLGLTDLVSEPYWDLAPWGIPLEHRPALKKRIAGVVSTRPRSEWLRLLQESDVPCAPILTREQLISDPQVAHNRMRVEVDDPRLGKTVQMGVPVKLSHTPGEVRWAAPLLGQHTAEVLKSLGPLSEAGPGRPTVAGPRPPDFPLLAPLAGVRVLDFTSFLAAGMVGMFLAHLGADVVKVEPHEGDPYRQVGFSFAATNRGKRSLVVNLTKKEGRELVHELVKNTDVVVTNVRPGAAGRLGIDYDTLGEIKAGLVYCHVTAWGTSGPYSHLPGYDPLVQARSGLMRAQGGKDGEPALVYIGVMDQGTGLCALYGIISALYHREKTGEGQKVESPIINTGLAVQSGEMLFAEGKCVGRDGGRDFIGVSALRRLYRCADSWLMLCSDSDECWERLAGATGREDLFQRFAFEKALAEGACGDLASELEEVFSKLTVQDWLRVLAEAQIPSSAARSYRELYRDEYLRSKGLLALEDNPEWGRLWLVGNPFGFGVGPPVSVRRSPMLGEHTAEFLGEAGISPERMEEMRNGRIIA